VQILKTFKVKVAKFEVVNPVTVPIIFKVYVVPSYDEEVV
jgi:hypothetical protein